MFRTLIRRVSTRGFHNEPSIRLRILQMNPSLESMRFDYNRLADNEQFFKKHEIQHVIDSHQYPLLYFIRALDRTSEPIIDEKCNAKIAETTKKITNHNLTYDAVDNDFKYNLRITSVLLAFDLASLVAFPELTQSLYVITGCFGYFALKTSWLFINKTIIEYERSKLYQHNSALQRVVGFLVDHKYIQEYVVRQKRIRNNNFNTMFISSMVSYSVYNCKFTFSQFHHSAHYNNLVCLYDKFSDIGLYAIHISTVFFILRYVKQLTSDWRLCYEYNIPLFDFWFPNYKQYLQTFLSPKD